MHLHRRMGLGIACCLILGKAQLAGATEQDEIVAQAREAYDRGAAAYDARQYARAAAELSRADALVPNPVVLSLAMRSVLRGDDPVLGMTLVQRAEGRSVSEELAALTLQARQRFAARVGQVTIHCPLGRRCQASLDGTPAVVGAARWIPVGDCVIELSVDGRTERQIARVTPGGQLDVVSAVPDAPPPPAPVAASPVPVRTRAPVPRRGISSTWLWVGGAVTTALGAAAVLSGLDTSAKHDAFVSGPTPQGKSSGEAAQLRTNVLIGAATAAALGTGFVAFSVTRSSQSTAATTTRITLGAATATFWLAF